MTGIRLNEQCPVDCPSYELNGQMKFKTSGKAMELYSSYPEIKNMAANRKELDKIDVQIKEAMKGFKEPGSA
jgi:hypothetical protein